MTVCNPPTSERQQRERGGAEPGKLPGSPVIQTCQITEPPRIFEKRRMAPDSWLFTHLRGERGCLIQWGSCSKQAQHQGGVWVPVPASQSNTPLEDSLSRACHIRMPLITSPHRRSSQHPTPRETSALQRQPGRGRHRQRLHPAGDARWLRLHVARPRCLSLQAAQQHHSGQGMHFVFLTKICHLSFL